MEHFFSGFEIVLQWQYIGYMFAGVSFGLILGFLPGLHGGIGIALMLPFSYEMDSLPALLFLLSIYTGSIFGGGVTSILFNTPGSAANIATTFDGYPMSRNGEPERALGLALMSSFTGGLIGCTCLLLLAQPMARFALCFGPGEMFMVMVFGLSVVGSLSSDMLKSLFSGVIGVLLGTIGTNATGVVRGTLDFVYLRDGVPLVPAFLGFLALPEIYSQIAVPMKFGNRDTRIDVRRFILGIFETFRHWIRAVVCSIVGVIVGIVPAAGAAIAGLLCYNQSKQLSRHPERYGKGIPEGIVSCETANNASQGGSLATMYVLGIPGSGATAVLLGALILQGWTPGPKLFFQYGEILYASISSLFLQQFVMLLLGAGLCLLGSRIVRLPFLYLMPCIIVFMVLGAYSTRYTLFDPALMFFFSAVGMLMKKNDYPIPPLILGLMLGSIMDIELTRVMQSYNSFLEIFHSPIVCVLMAVTIGSFVSPIILAKVKVLRIWK